MNLRYLYNHHKNTVTIQAELMRYLPAENAPHSWSTRKLRHRMAACTHGESWSSLPYKTPACNKYQAISPAALQRREEKIAEIQNTPYR